MFLKSSPINMINYDNRGWAVRCDTFNMVLR